MLVSKLHLTRCHSPIVLRAQSRFASTLLLGAAQPFSAHQVHTSQHDAVLLSEHIHASARPSFQCHTNFGRAQISTTSVLRRQLRTIEKKFLKPRGRPTFRKRSPSEHEVFLNGKSETNSKDISDKGEYPDIDRREFDAPEGKQEDIDVGDTFTLYPRVPHQDTSEAMAADTSRLEDDRAIPHRGYPKSSQESRLQTSTANLEAELQYLAHNDSNPTAIHQILKILISDRKVKPTSEHYEALVLANIWPEYGSVDNVEKILAEMETGPLGISTNVIAAVLKVLAVHPSPELSRKMLAMVQRRWIQISPQIHHHLILGKIRAGQTELAMSMLEDMILDQMALRSRDREIMPDYLVVALITELVEQGDWEGILRYMYDLRDRRAADRDIPTMFWAWLLEQASKAAREVLKAARSASSDLNTPDNNPPQNPQATPSTIRITMEARISLSNPAKHVTEHIWTLYVTSMSIRPSWSTCLDILHIAADTGTVWLAESAHAVLVYMDGVDENGRPLAVVSPRITKLVEVAKKKALKNETERLRLLGRDIDEERRRAEEIELEKKKLQKEDEMWWDELISGYDDVSKTSAKTGEDGSSIHNGGDDRKNSSPRSEKHNGPPHGDVSLNLKLNDNFTSMIAPTQYEKFQPIDKTTSPPGNLWPLFPSIGSLDSAYIDPWEALGPRSSSRRKWTEAQQYWKHRDGLVKKMQRGNLRRPSSEKGN